MKKKVVLMTAVLGVCALALAGCGKKKTEEKAQVAAEDTTEKTKTADEGVFVVGFDAEYPPYGYMDENGEYTGFDLELAQAVADLEGWELKKEPIAWDSKDMILDSGAIDCIWNGFTMTGREDAYTWSVPYVDNSQVVVVSESSGIEDLSGLAGKVVGVQADSSALALLEDEEGQKELADTFGTLQQFGDYNTGFAELSAGSIDALAMDIGVALYQIKGRDGFKILDEYLNAEEYAVGFKKGNEELRDIINADLQVLLENGTFDELAEKYELTDMVSLGKDSAEEEAVTEAAAAGAYVPGTYSASAAGMDGDVTVEITVDETSITEVKVDVSGETAGIGAEIGETMEGAIMDAQAADVDGVTGATVSSDAVKAAAADALAQAAG